MQHSVTSHTLFDHAAGRVLHVNATGSTLAAGALTPSQRRRSLLQQQRQQRDADIHSDRWDVNMPRLPSSTEHTTVSLQTLSSVADVHASPATPPHAKRSLSAAARLLRAHAQRHGAGEADSLARLLRHGVPASDSDTGDSDGWVSWGVQGLSEQDHVQRFLSPPPHGARLVSLTALPRHMATVDDVTTDSFLMEEALQEPLACLRANAAEDRDDRSADAPRVKLSHCAALLNTVRCWGE